MICRQIIGISLAFDPAQCFANLFLYHYENEQFKKVKKKKIREARKLSNVFRLIDELTAFNEGGEFEQRFQEICHPELFLKKQTISKNEGSFLDLVVKIGNNQFSVQLCGKSYDFPFFVVRTLYLRSNITSKTFSFSYGSEIVRARRATISALIYEYHLQTFPKFLSDNVNVKLSKVNPNKGNEAKSDIFYGIYSNLKSFSFFQKILKYYNYFYN